MSLDFSQMIPKIQIFSENCVLLREKDHELLVNSANNSNKAVRQANISYNLANTSENVLKFEDLMHNIR